METEWFQMLGAQLKGPASEVVVVGGGPGGPAATGPQSPQTRVLDEVRKLIS